MNESITQQGIKDYNSLSTEMQTASNVMNKPKTNNDLLKGLFSQEGNTDPDPKKKKPYDMGAELRKYGSTKMKYDDDETAVAISDRVAKSMGMKPSVLLSSAWQEGMNKAALKPDDVSDYYNKANISGDFPVDGFLNYGVDTIGDKWDKVKKYLPKGFESKMQFFNAVNEKGEKVKTAAFDNNESALMGKAAMMKYERENASAYAVKKGLKLDDNTLDYFMLAGYNGGGGNAIKMINEYAADPNKDKFISEGHSKNGVHKNIKIRMDNEAISDELLKNLLNNK